MNDLDGLCFLLVNMEEQSGTGIYAERQILRFCAYSLWRVKLWNNLIDEASSRWSPLKVSP